MNSSRNGFQHRQTLNLDIADAAGGFTPDGETRRRIADNAIPDIFGRFVHAQAVGAAPGFEADRVIVVGNIAMFNEHL